MPVDNHSPAGPARRRIARRLTIAGGVLALLAASGLTSPQAARAAATGTCFACGSGTGTGGSGGGGNPTGGPGGTIVGGPGTNICWSPTGTATPGAYCAPGATGSVCMPTGTVPVTQIGAVIVDFGQFTGPGFTSPSGATVPNSWACGTPSVAGPPPPPPVPPSAWLVGNCLPEGTVTLNGSQFLVYDHIQATAQDASVVSSPACTPVTSANWAVSLSPQVGSNMWKLSWATAGPPTYTWNWGDGTTTAGNNPDTHSFQQVTKGPAVSVTATRVWRATLCVMDVTNPGAGCLTTGQTMTIGPAAAAAPYNCRVVAGNTAEIDCTRTYVSPSFSVFQVEPVGIAAA